MIPTVKIDFIFSTILAIFFIYTPRSTQTTLLSTCFDIPKLNFEPGLGWDALTNKDTGQTLHLTYDKCKTTKDGQYLIPDQTEDLSDNTTEIQIINDLIYSWSNYTGITARGFVKWPKNLTSLYFSFSDEYQQLKKLQVQHTAFTSRAQVRRLVYRINVLPNIEINATLKKRFLEVIRALSQNQTEKAHYLVQAIVSDYGTHYTKNIDVGAALIREDFLGWDLGYSSSCSKPEIKMMTNNSLYINYQYLQQVMNQHSSSAISTNCKRDYQNMLLHTRILLIGGADGNWLTGNIKNVTIINRLGDLLPSLVNSSQFPKATSSTLNKFQEMLSNAIQNYFSDNIHQGCMMLNAQSYDYKANLFKWFDESCTYVDDYVFGGVYNQCHETSYIKPVTCNSHDLYNNPLTGSASCPKYFSGYYMQYRKIEFTYYTESCNRFLVWNFCDDDSNIGVTTVGTIFCLNNRTGAPSTNYYQFGGTFSSNYHNVHTRSNYCPSGFTDFRVLQGALTICISKRSNGLSRYSLPFGGFIDGSPTTYYNCPNGYSKHPAVIYNGYSIGYCVKNAGSSKTYGRIPLLIRPKNVNISEIFPKDGNSSVYMEYDDYGLLVEEELDFDVSKYLMLILIPCGVVALISLICCKKRSSFVCLKKSKEPIEMEVNNKAKFAVYYENVQNPRQECYNIYEECK